MSSLAGILRKAPPSARPKIIAAWRNKTMDEALEDRDLAIVQVDENADKAWRTYANEFIYEYATKNPKVFVDDLWKAGLEPPREPRALGARIRHAVAEGWIENSGRSRPSVHSHGGLKPVWASNVWAGPR